MSPAVGGNRVPPSGESALGIRLRGGEVDAEIAPLVCPACRAQLPGMFHHTPSRYGHVGRVDCDACGAAIACADDDWIRRRLVLSVPGAEDEVIDYAALYRLGPDIRQPLGLGDDFELADVVARFEARLGLGDGPLRGASPDPRFPVLPRVVLRWFRVLEALGIR